jgi:hypothetical protein
LNNLPIVNWLVVIYIELSKKDHNFISATAIERKLESLDEHTYGYET